MTTKYFLIGFLAALMAATVIAALSGSARAEVNNLPGIVLDSQNHTSIREEVNGVTINNALQAITKSDSTKPFYLYLDSPGGKVLEGRRLVSYLLTTDRNIICVSQTAISMAFVIMQACKVRLVTEHSILMTHEIAGGAQGPLREMKASLLFTQKLADLYDNMMAARMGLTLEAYRAHINPEFWMVGFKEALDNHAADGVVKVTCTQDLEKKVDTFGEGKEKYSVSQCPVA